MSFAADYENEQQRNRGMPGRYQAVAVGCWYTSSGRVLPQIVKYQDEDGCIHTLQNIRLIRTEKMHYGGLASRRFDCSAVIGEYKREFSLLYHPDSDTWDMILKE